MEFRTVRCPVMPRARATLEDLRLTFEGEWERRVTKVRKLWEGGSHEGVRHF